MFFIFISFVVIMPTGKTNHGVKLYGRCLRHSNVFECGVGSFALYLCLRFEMSGEMDPPPDFSENKEWFDLKLLTDASKENNRQSMSNDSYAKGIKKVLGELGIVSKHYVHLGRVMAPIYLEFLEVEQNDIRILGNWDPKTQESRYSTKLPMKALRMMAGFSDSGGMHYNIRVVVEPPIVLQEMIFSFVEVCLQIVYESITNDGKDRYTAVCFLKMLLQLRRVVLQDAAAMIVLDPSRREHAIFRHLPVFQHPQWEVSFFVISNFEIVKLFTHLLFLFSPM
jgi:hypothetical protein